MVEQPKQLRVEMRAGDSPLQGSFAVPGMHVCTPERMLLPILGVIERSVAFGIDEPMWKSAGISSQLK
jgi:hypothetical protein